MTPSTVTTITSGGVSFEKRGEGKRVRERSSAKGYTHFESIPDYTIGNLFTIVSLAARGWFAGGWCAYRTVWLSQIQETDMPSLRTADALIYRFCTDGA
jgi:hypothetical protein